MKHSRRRRCAKRGGGWLPDRISDELNVPLAARASKVNDTLKNAWGAVTSSVTSLLNKQVSLGASSGSIVKTGGRRRRGKRGGNCGATGCAVAAAQSGGKRRRHKSRK